MERSEPPQQPRWINYAPLATPASAPAARHSRGFTLCCIVTGDKFTIEEGPTPDELTMENWSYLCPSCGETHAPFQRDPNIDTSKRSRKIEIELDLDLGELVPGQHIVLRGIELRTNNGSLLHYDFSPGFPRSDTGLEVSWGLGEIHDDLGSEYSHGSEGGWGAHPDGMVYWGDEHLGRGIPSTASWITIEFYPAYEVTPSDGWVSSVTLALPSGSVLTSRREGGTPTSE